MTNPRPAQPDDIPHIIELAADLVRLHTEMDPARFDCPDPAATYTQWIESLTARDDALVLVVPADKPVRRLDAYLIAEVAPPQHHFWATQTLWVHDVFVRPDARTRGIAARLTHLAADFARAHNVPRIRVLCAHANTNAQRFFTNQGARPTAVELSIEL